MEHRNNFNPRPLAGATSGRSSKGGAEEIFQSTPPCGGDHTVGKESDILSISIHAPLRGRHSPDGDSCQYSGISIHAPLRGRLFLSIAETVFHKISIHAPLRGRRVQVFIWNALEDFNPRPLAGAT